MFHYLHCIVLHSCFLKVISFSFSSIYSFGSDFMMALSQLKWNLSHLTLTIHSQFSFLATTTTHPDAQWTGSVRKSGEFLTGQVSRFIYVIGIGTGLVMGTYSCRKSGGMNPLDIASLPFSRSWDLVFVSSLFGALLLSCLHSLTIFLKCICYSLDFHYFSFYCFIVFHEEAKKADLNCGSGMRTSGFY